MRVDDRRQSGQYCGSTHRRRSQRSCFLPIEGMVLTGLISMLAPVLLALLENSFKIIMTKRIPCDTR